MKQTNHTPELKKSADWFQALPLDTKDYLSRKYFNIELFSSGDDGFIEESGKELTLSMVHQMYLLETQQQTDKLYTREELKDATDKAFAAGMSRQWASDYGEVPNQYPTHEQWFNQNYPK